MKKSQQSIIITGASGGIGSSLCQMFKDKGYFVIATDKIKIKAPYDLFIEMDLMDYVYDLSLRKNFIKKINQVVKSKKLIGLINNAAIQLLDNTINIDIDDFNKSIDINVKAPLLLVQDLFSFLEDSKGTVINIGSIHSDLTKKDFLSYAVSKSALKGLTRSLSIDLASHGISTNMIQPAAIRTQMLESGFSKNKDGLRQLSSFHPLGKIGEPKEIAKIALFLIENKDSFINGATIQLDGGISGCLHDPN
jgi:NAD(P)-dependent dehydrogenase (short-subunit alcohol dehydrogenase family)